MRRRRQSHPRISLLAQAIADLFTGNFSESALDDGAGDQPDHFVQETVPIDFNRHSRTGSSNFYRIQRSHCIRFRLAAICREAREIMSSDKQSASALDKVDIQ